MHTSLRRTLLRFILACGATAAAAPALAATQTSIHFSTAPVFSTFKYPITLKATMMPDTVPGKVEWRLYSPSAVSTLCTANNVSGSATCSFDDLPLGSSELYVCFYPTDSANYLSSCSSNPAPEGDGSRYTYAVLPAPTTTQLTSSLATAAPGQNITFTASVTGANGVWPNGSVTFYETAAGVTTQTLCSAASTPNAQNPGVVTCSASFASAGAHTVKAQFVHGDTHLGDSSRSITQLVNAASAAATTTAVVAVTNPITVGHIGAFNVTVTSANGTPDGGSVDIQATAPGLSTESCQTVLVAGHANCSMQFHSAATMTITATYGGNATWAGSTGTGADEVVNKETSSVQMTSSPNPGMVGTPITLSATVSGWKPGGTVDFVRAALPGSAVGITACTANVAFPSGIASCSATFPTAGSYTVSASYSGDDDNLASRASATQVIQAAAASPSAVPAPTLSFWALAILPLMLALLACYRSKLG